MSQNLMLFPDFDFERGISHALDHGSFHLDHVFFCDFITSFRA
jgi:hypothetical protein